MTTDIDTLMVSGSDAKYDDTSAYVEPLTVNVYKFMDDAYFGEAGFKDGTYLTPHTREMFWNARRTVSTYKNFVKPILSAMVSPVFADDIPRDMDTNSLFASFVEDVDNNRTSLDTAIHEAVDICVRHGQVFVVMDNFEASDMPETIMEAREKRFLPYIMVKTALDVDDYELDRWGNLLSITFVDLKLKRERETVQTYRTWTPEHSVVSIKKGSKLEPIEDPKLHGLGVIPVLVMYSSPRRDKTKLCINPPHYDIARIALGIYNKESEVRDLERAQSFSVLCVQTDRGGNLSLGSRNVLFVPMETQFMPQFISPNPSILVGLMVNAEKMRDDMYKLAEQSGVTAVKSEASGVSEAYRFFGHESVLQKVSAMAKALDMAIYDLFCLYTSETGVYEADYPTDFAPGNIQVEVDTLDKYLKQDLPPKAKSLALQKWTRLILSDQDPVALDAAIEEIDGAYDEPEASIIEPIAPTPPEEEMPEELEEETEMVE